MTWSLAEAKTQLSEVVRRAMARGPQIISVRGRRAAVVVSTADYERLRDRSGPASFKSLLASMNLDGVDLERDPSRARDFDL